METAALSIFRSRPAAFFPNSTVVRRLTSRQGASVDPFRCEGSTGNAKWFTVVAEIHIADAAGAALIKWVGPPAQRDPRIRRLPLYI